ncbi:MAG: DNA-deoxyinosine glycosylase [Haliangiales bacterium]
MTQTKPPPSLTAMPPIAAPGATVLILGSMPGAKSLADQQYYAHPRNAFWSIMDTLGVSDRGAPYAERCQALTAGGVALWDVIASCRREGSLDSAIRAETPNDLAGFARAQPDLRLVVFNGRKAHDVFVRFAKRGDPRVALPQDITLAPLPSTSPANTRRDKIEPWIEILRDFVHR